MSVIESSPLSILESNLKRHNLQGEPLLVAWSGGRDSTLLVYLLHKLNKNPLYTAYYNHKMRENSELNKEISLIRDQAKQWQISLTLGEVEQADRWDPKTSSGESPEEWARNRRYPFLVQTALEKGAKAILTAHFEQDFIETQIQRFFQGYNMVSSGDMRINHQFAVPVVRPLLDISEELMDQSARAYSLSWSEDSSNENKSYLRNRIRAELLPQLKSLFPQLDKALWGSHHRHDLVRKGIKQQLHDLLEPGKNSIDLVLFYKQQPYLRAEILFYLMDLCLRGKRSGYRIPYRFIRDLVEGEESSKFKFQGHGLCIFSESGELKIEVLKKEKSSLVLDEVALVPGQWLSIGTIRIRIDNHPLRKDSRILPASKHPWVIRGRQEGDNMGKPGRLKKKLSSYSREQRSLIPLLANGSQVLLILKGPVKELLFSLKDQVCDGEFFLSLEEIVTF